MIHKFWLMLFYGIANHLPDSYTMILGRPSNKLRIKICKYILKIQKGNNHQSKDLFRKWQKCRDWRL